MNSLHLGLWILPIILLHNTEALLLSKCSSDSDCNVAHSYCQSGLCICQPFFAQHNLTCLPSRLLDEQCIVEEQCTMKVAQSTCSGGKCKCSNGFLQFRHHTCLSAAKPGDVCLNNEHCKLWSKNSHCHYLIPNLIGRCTCSTQTKLIGSFCLREEDAANLEKERVTESVTETLPSNKTDDGEESWSGAEPDAGPEEQQNEDSDDYIFKVKIPPKNDPSVSDPFYDQKKHHIEKNSTPTADTVNLEVGGTTDGEDTKMDLKHQGHTEELLQETQESSSNLSEVNFRGNTNTTSNPMELITYKKGQSNESSSTHNNQAYLKYWESKNIVSLGLPCLHDRQCEAADNASKCINNVCECAVTNNDTEHCSGCAPETFQCHSSGVCLSWFFVCDGKIDCSDGSDEECHGSPCPKHSYQCGEEGICVSRSTLCDGVRNCPNGEDELLCERNEAKCPANSFQCKNGQCLPEYEFCNAIPACSDGSDELEELCGAQFSEGRPRKVDDDCPFRCNNGRCRSTAILCSGRDGCGDNSDEQYCEVCRCSLKV